jgi:hypothetical protein
MANLKVTRTVLCPQTNEQIEVSNVCELCCEYYRGSNYDEDPSNPDVVCSYGEKK